MLRWPARPAAPAGPLAATWRLPWALAAGQLLGIAALVTLLGSFRTLGQRLGAHELVQRAGRAMGFLAIVASFVVELRYAELRGLLRQEILVPASMVVLVLALVSIAKALGVVRFFGAYLLGLGGERESGAPMPLSPLGATPETDHRGRMARLLTPRLILTIPRDDDRADFRALSADPTVMRYFPSVQSAVESDALVARCQESFATRGLGLFTVRSVADGAFVGFVGLRVHGSRRTSAHRCAPDGIGAS